MNVNNLTPSEFCIRYQRFVQNATPAQKKSAERWNQRNIETELPKLNNYKKHFFLEGLDSIDPTAVKECVLHSPTPNDYGNADFLISTALIDDHKKEVYILDSGIIENHIRRNDDGSIAEGSYADHKKCLGLFSYWCKSQNLIAVNAFFALVMCQLVLHLKNPQSAYIQISKPGEHLMGLSLLDEAKKMLAKMNEAA